MSNVRTPKISPNSLELSFARHRELLQFAKQDPENFKRNIQLALALAQNDDICEGILNVTDLEQPVKSYLVDTLEGVNFYYNELLSLALDTLENIKHFLKDCDKEIFTKREFYEAFFIMLFLKTKESINFSFLCLKILNDFLNDRITEKQFLHKMTTADESYSEYLTHSSNSYEDHLIEITKFHIGIESLFEVLADVNRLAIDYTTNMWNLQALSQTKNSGESIINTVKLIESSIKPLLQKATQLEEKNRLVKFKSFEPKSVVKFANRYITNPSTSSFFHHEKFTDSKKYGGYLVNPRKLNLMLANDSIFQQVLEDREKEAFTKIANNLKK